MHEGTGIAVIRHAVGFQRIGIAFGCAVRIRNHRMFRFTAPDYDLVIDV